MSDFYLTEFAGRFDTEKELRSGKRGRVLLVRDKNAGERYIYREFEGGGEVYCRLTALNCPHLPRVYEVRERDGLVAVLEEYIPGDTLAFVLEGGTLPEDKAAGIAAQLCEALEALHAAGAVHRDIKPENVMLRGGEAVLIDFDASRIHKSRVTTDTRVMGTTGYAAPEQYGLTQTDARADIYSLGVLLNEMLTGCHPSVRLAEGALRPVIERCIEVNVDKRYASARELRRALDGAGSGLTRGRKRLMALIAVVAAAAVAAVLLFAPRGGAEASQWSRQTFSYDLDGDGETETYIFGVGMDLPGRRPGGVDSRVLTGDITDSVTAAPCVWRMDDDGNYAVVYEFAALLTEPEVELTCVEKWSADEPEVRTDQTLDGYWTGALEALYTADCAGEWRYSASAVLDGETLTGTATTVIEREPMA